MAGLKGYWKIDEPSGSTLADAVGTTNASFTGTRVAGVLGGGMGPQSQGTLSVNPVNLNGGSWTVMTWFKFDTGQTGGYILGNQVGPNNPGPSGYLNVWMGPVNVFATAPSGTVSPAPTASANAWHHLAVIYDSASSMLSMFVDGRAQGSMSAPQAQYGAAQPFTLGGLFSGTVAGHLFNGQTDEYAIFDRALSAAELQTIHSQIALPIGATPTPEVCDGLDNDQDGVVDDGNPGGGASCGTGLQGACSAGSMSCMNGSLSCRQTLQPSAETCDGIDNNCDGVVDEGCTPGVGPGGNGPPGPDGNGPPGPDGNGPPGPDGNGPPGKKP